MCIEVSSLSKNLQEQTKYHVEAEINGNLSLSSLDKNEKGNTRVNIKLYNSTFV